MERSVISIVKRGKQNVFDVPAHHPSALQAWLPRNTKERWSDHSQKPHPVCCCPLVGPTEAGQQIRRGSPRQPLPNGVFSVNARRTPSSALGLECFRLGPHGATRMVTAGGLDARGATPPRDIFTYMYSSGPTRSASQGWRPATTCLRLYLSSCRGARQPLIFAGSGQGALASSPLASMGREPPRWRPIIGVTPAATKSNPTRAWRGRGARPPGGAPVGAAQARRSRPQRSCHAWRERRSVAPLHYGGGGGGGSASTRTCPPRCTVAEPDCVALTATLACESGPAPPSLSSAPATFRSAPTVWGEGVLHLLY